MFKMQRYVLAGVAALAASFCFSVDASAGPYVRQARHRPAYTTYHSRYRAPSHSYAQYYGCSYSYPRYYTPSYGVTYARPYRYVSYASPYLATYRPATRVIYDAPTVEYVVPAVSEATVVYQDYDHPTYRRVVPSVRSYYYDYDWLPYRHHVRSFGFGFGYGGGHHGHHGSFGFRWGF